MTNTMNKPALTTVSDVILSVLAAWGVKRIYGVAGDANLPLLDSLGKQTAIQYIPTRHETAAALMASAEGKCTGTVAVSLGTSGPGLSNMLNGIADAASDRIPLLVITGQVPTDKIGTNAVQYVDQQQLIAPLAVYSASLTHPRATVTLLRKALIEAISKKGVAHISVPENIFTTPCTDNVTSPAGVLFQSTPRNIQQLNQAAASLSAAKQPMILIGEGARTAADHVLSLAEKLHAGIIETLGAKGIVPYHHPLNLGGIGEGGTDMSMHALKQADCILVVGANWWPQGFVPQHTQVIQIDTAPEAIEAHPKMTYGLVGPASEILPLLETNITVNTSPGWKRQLANAKQSIEGQLSIERQTAGYPIAPQHLVAALDETVQPNAIVTVDTGDHTVWFNRIFRAKRQHVLYSGKWRTMGFALPAAIAAQLAYPDRQVVALSGDGGFAMTMMELSTAVQLNLPITVVVVNNDALGMEKNSMIARGLQPFGVDLFNPDFAALATSFGAHGIRIQSEAQFRDGLKTALSTPAPSVIDVPTSCPMVPLLPYKEAVKLT